MKNLTKLAVLLTALFVLGGLVSCDLNDSGSDSLAIVGTWDYTTTGDGTLVVTDSTYSVDMSSSTYDWYYAGDIVSYDNSGWNGTETGEGSYGYLVYKLTSHSSSYYSGYIGKYVVVRWQNFVDGTSMEYLDGSSEYFDTVDEALEGATEADGVFTASYWDSSKVYLIQ